MVSNWLKSVKISRLLPCFAAFLFFVFSALIVLSANDAMRKQALEDAEQKARIIMSHSLLILSHDALLNRGKSFELPDPNGTTDMFDSGSISLIHAHQGVHRSSSTLREGIYYCREYAINTRKPENKADEWEKAFIEEVNSDPLLQTRSAVRNIDGRPYLAMLGRGETMEETCLRCHSAPESASKGTSQTHGKEQAPLGHRFGEVVSAISVRIPVYTAHEAANAFSWKLSGMLLTIFFALSASWLYVGKRFLFGPLSAIRRRAMEISSNSASLGEEIPVPQGRELSELTTAFNEMSAALRLEKEGFEQRIRDRLVEIRNAQALVSGVINSSEEVIYVKGTDFRYLVCNAAFLKVIGCGEDEVIGYSDSELLLSGDSAEHFQKWDQWVLEEGRGCRVREEISHTDGKVVLYETTRSPYMSETGKPLGVIGVARDITERTLAEEALRKSEEKFAKAFHASPTAMSLSTLREGCVIDVNGAFEILTGYRREDILGRSSIELGLVEPEERLRLMGIVDAHGRIRDTETTLRRSSGEVLLLRISAEPVNIAGEQCVLFIAEDITEKKRMEEALRESEKLFSEIFHLSPEMAIITQESDGTVIAVNDAFLKTCGFRREEVVGKTTLELGIWGSMSDRQNLLDAYRRDGIVQNAETVLYKKSGEPFPVLYSLVSVEFKGKSCLFAVGIDITERRRAEEERERLERLLHHSQKMEAVGTLAGGIAHDFNNILAAIIGYTELCKTDTIDPVAKNGFLDQILKASLRARDLVKQILIFSRMESAEEPQPLSLSLVVKETLKLLRASIPATIEIRTKISVVSDTVLADPAQLNQVLVNLATNAAHAMEEGGGVLEVSLNDIRFGADIPMPHPDMEPGDYVLLCVIDTGHGIPTHTLDRIFDPYFTTKEAGKGTGLGLAIVHGIVKRHGGAVTVESEEGEGTTFRVYLPKAKSVFREEFAGPAEAPEGAERVLLIDDEKPVADVVSAILRVLGYRVISKTRPADALALFQKDPSQFDLVITDYTMPEITGAEIVVYLRDLRPDIPIIMVTGYSERMSEEKAKALNIDAFLLKPLQRSELAQTVRKVIDARKDYLVDGSKTKTRN